MEIRFADRMQHLKASEIREILKLTARPEVISFAGGLPATESFPVDDIASAVHACCAEDGAAVLQYSTTEGDPDLRAAIAKRMNRLRGTAVSPDDILVTSGSQQGLDLSAKLFLDRGTTVLCESPTYLAALNAFKVFEPRLVAVPTDDDGMRPDALAAALRTEPDVRLIYVIPDSQNPSGRTWSMERRRALVELAAEAGTVVVEDSPYGEIRFDGAPLPSVASLAGDRTTVVYLGTFSKVFCPGMRLGWVAAPRPILNRYVLLKQSADLHTSTLTQRIAARYLASHDLDLNIARVIGLYRERRDAMLTYVIDARSPRRALPGLSELDPPPGRTVHLGRAARGDRRQGAARTRPRAAGGVRAGCGLLSRAGARPHHAPQLLGHAAGPHPRRHPAARLGARRDARTGGHRERARLNAPPIRDNGRHDHRSGGGSRSAPQRCG